MPYICIYIIVSFRTDLHCHLTDRRPYSVYNQQENGAWILHAKTEELPGVLGQNNLLRNKIGLQKQQVYVDTIWLDSQTWSVDKYVSSKKNYFH